MKMRDKLVGKRFLKISDCGDSPGLEYVQVLEYDKERGQYLVAFWSGDYESGLGELPHSNISWVQDFILESYATTDQKKVRTLREYYYKATVLMSNIRTQCHMHQRMAADEMKISAPEPREPTEILPF